MNQVFYDRGKVLWLMAMSLILMLSMLPYVSFVAVAPLVQQEWRLSNTAVGFIFSAFMVGYAVASLFVLPLPDRIGSRKVIIGSLFLSGLGHLLFPIAGSGMLSATLLRLLPGAGFVGVYMPALRIISQRFPARGRGTAMGAFVSAAYAASSLSLALTGALISVMEWREAYLVVAALSLLSVPLGLLVVPGEKAPAAGRATLRLGVLKERGVRLLVLGYGIHNWELFMMRLWLAPFLAQLLLRQGRSPEEVAATAAAIAALLFAPGIAGPFLGGALSDRVGRSRAATIILSVSASCALGLGWLGGLPWAFIIALGLLYGLSLAADSSLYSTGITELSPSHWLGSAMAVQSFFGFATGLVAPVTFGAVLDLAPPSLSWGLAFSAGAVAGFLGVVAMLYLHRLPESRLMAGGKG